MRWAAGLLACLMLLSGCDFVTTDVEGLLEKPTLNERQAEVYRALEETMNLGAITYRRPQRGEYRSSFLFYDMDGDGFDEALVFYAIPNEAQSTHILILREEDGGGWGLVRDYPVAGDQIDFVQFSRLTSANGVCLVIGWQTPLTRNNRENQSFLTIHSYSGGDFVPEVERQTYLDYTVQDFDGDGLEEIITVERDSGQTYQLSLLRAIGRRIGVASTLPLSPGVENIERISTGSISRSRGALYLDVRRNDFGALLPDEQDSGLAYATEVVQVDRDGLTVLAGGAAPGEAEEPAPAWTAYAYTFRAEPFFCQDVDGDGQIEVPATSLTLPGDLNDFEAPPIRLTPYLYMSADGFDLKINAVVNNEEGYLLEYPEKWEGKVAVQQTDNADEWRFYVIDDTGEPAIELLRILAYSAQEADAENPDEIALGSRGTRHFSGYIPSTEDAAAISEQELHDHFLLPVTTAS
jgi:hypothetical protein